MTENPSLVLKTPRYPKNAGGKIKGEKNSMSISEKAIIKPSVNSIASTEINSIKKISIEENLTPKKKPKSKLEAIKTFCRIRPTKDPNELFFISQKDDKILNINSENLEKLNVGNNLKLINSYKFSKVFDENSTQEEVFELTCKPLIDDLVVNNKSGLIFTYGMTNAGKTYTVIGTPEYPGILPLALKNLMEYEKNELNQMKIDNFSNNFYCNFVEIYNEDVFDLLADDPTGKNKYYKKKLTVKENLNSVFFLQDVTYAKLDTLDSFNNILNKGIAKKVHSSTTLNQNSSRSHTIFKIILLKENKDINRIDFTTEELISLSVVDLAGSERQKRTDAKGKNLQEACKINQSLSTLGKCLEAMKHNSVSNNKKMVPLRESKLTKLFAEYFQGDQNIIMITNINPTTADFEETIRALNYSCIARDIKPMKSVIPKLTAGNELKQQLKKEKKLNEIQNSNANSNSNMNNLLDKKNNENGVENDMNNIISNKNNTEMRNEQKLNDSLTLNLNELFNSNSNFDDMLDKEMKTEFTRAPEASSTKEEIARLTAEINKLREEVKEFKNDNSEFQKSKLFGLQSESQSVKGLSYDKNKLNYITSNLRPFSQSSTSENNLNNLRFLPNNELNMNMTSFNCGDSVLSQGPNNFFSNNPTSASSNPFQPINNNMQNNNNFGPMNTQNNNSLLTSYGNYGFPFNNPFLPYYGNMFGGPFLPLPDPNTTEKKNNKLANGKKGKKNKKSNDLLSNTFGNLIPGGLTKGINLIFVNPKFGNLMQGQSILEESMEYSDSDDENSVPKKKKAKGTPKKKKKKNNKNKIQKQYLKNKNRPRYPKMKNNESMETDESLIIKENEEEDNDDASEFA